MKHCLFKIFFLSFLFFSSVLIGSVLNRALVFAQDSIKGDLEDLAQCGDAEKLADQFFDTIFDSLDIFSPAQDLFKNACQLNDLIAIDNQITNAKNQFQTAFQRCDQADIEAKKENFRRLVFAQEYLRRFVECPDNENCYSSVGENVFLVDLENKLTPDLKDRFVKDKKWWDATTFEEVFDETQQRYANRFSAYAECNSSDWKLLEAKLQDLWGNLKFVFSHDPLTTVKTLGSEEIAREEAQREQRKKQGVQSFGDLGEMGKNLWNSPIETIGKGISKRVGVKVNDLEPKKGLQEILNSVETLLPGSEYLSDEAKEFLESSSPAPTFTDIQRQLAEESEKEDLSFDEEYLLARYQFLYAEGTDEMTSHMVKKLDILQNTIDETLPYLDSITQCTDRVAQRQCINK